jgi:hypothetical protein
VLRRREPFGRAGKRQRRGMPTSDDDAGVGPVVALTYRATVDVPVDRAIHRRLSDPWASNVFRPSPLDDEIATLDVAEVTQARSQRLDSAKLRGKTR